MSGANWGILGGVGAKYFFFGVGRGGGGGCGDAVEIPLWAISATPAVLVLCRLVATGKEAGLGHPYRWLPPLCGTWLRRHP